MNGEHEAAKAASRFRRTPAKRDVLRLCARALEMPPASIVPRVTRVGDRRLPAGWRESLKSSFRDQRKKQDWHYASQYCELDGCWASCTKGFVLITGRLRSRSW